MANIIIVIIIIAAVGLAIRYMYKEKKKGSKCIGCPYSGDGSCGECKDKS